MPTAASAPSVRQAVHQAALRRDPAQAAQRCLHRRSGDASTPLRQRAASAVLRTATAAGGSSGACTAHRSQGSGALSAMRALHPHQQRQSQPCRAKAHHLAAARRQPLTVRRRHGCTMREHGGAGAFAAIGACSISRLTPANSDLFISVVLRCHPGRSHFRPVSRGKCHCFG